MFPFNLVSVSLSDNEFDWEEYALCRHAETLGAQICLNLDDTDDEHPHCTNFGANTTRSYLFYFITQNVLFIGNIVSLNHLSIPTNEDRDTIED